MAVSSSHVFGGKGNPGTQNLVQNFHENNAHSSFLMFSRPITKPVCCSGICVYPLSVLTSAAGGLLAPPHNPWGLSASVTGRLSVLT